MHKHCRGLKIASDYSYWGSAVILCQRHRKMTKAKCFCYFVFGLKQSHWATSQSVLVRCLLEQITHFLNFTGILANNPLVKISGELPISNCAAKKASEFLRNFPKNDVFPYMIKYWRLDKTEFGHILHSFKTCFFTLPVFIKPCRQISINSSKAQFNIFNFNFFILLYVNMTMVNDI